jgi:serine/threonine protein kinase/ABC-type glycerol-3-phosphate transport system substrate-binding protein
MSLVGKSIGRYRILERLGQGGMAVVYKAYDTRLERDVALKVIRTENILPSQSEKFLKRFEREAKAQAKFEHPNIVPVHDYGEYEGAPYLVMAYRPGGTLKQKVGSPISYQEAAQLLFPIANALAYAHDWNVLHRDVKPSNILIAGDGTPTLTDFGIAKLLESDEATLTGTGLGVGTPEYMAPEQWRGKSVPQTDIYALGVVLYELITGRKPYTADTPAAVAIIQATEPLPLPSELVPDLPEKVEKVLFKAMTIEPEDRYESMAEFGKVLEELSQEARVEVMREPTEPELTPVMPQVPVCEQETSDDFVIPPASGLGKKNPPWLWIVLGLLLAVIVIGGGIGLALSGNEVAAIETKETATMTVASTVPDMATVTVTSSPVVELSDVTVTFWHTRSSGLPNETLMSIVDEFNATNEYGITVEILDQGGFSDVEDAMDAAIQSGDLPDLVTGYTNALASWASVDVMVDIATFISNTEHGLTEKELAAYLPGTLEGGRNAAGMQVGFPINQSVNVLFYNISFAQDLGFEAPPTTSVEFKEQACAAAAFNDASGDEDLIGTGGLVINPSASNYMSWIFAFGDDGVNETGDGYDYSSEASLAAATFLKDLWDSGCTLTTASYPNSEFASRKALFIMSSTAGLPYQIAAFEDIGSSDEWALMPFVGPDGRMAVYSFSKYIGVVKSTPEEELASWLFLKYLTSPELQAILIENSSGNYPIQENIILLLDEYMANNPIWATGLDLIFYGQAGPGWPSWTSVYQLLGDAFTEVLQADSTDAIPNILENLDTLGANLVAELD